MDQDSPFIEKVKKSIDLECKESTEGVSFPNLEPVQSAIVCRSVSAGTSSVSSDSITAKLEYHFGHRLVVIGFILLCVYGFFCWALACPNDPAAVLSNFLGLTGIFRSVFVMAIIPTLMCGVLAALPIEILISRKPVSISFNEKGITFSESWDDDLSGKRFRPWSDVHAIALSGKGVGASTVSWNRTYAPFPAPQLQFGFATGGMAVVVLPRWSQTEALKIFEAIDRWADASKLSQETVQLKESILSGETGRSYTEIWNKDLEMRHSSTCFLPLPNGFVIRNGQLKVLSILATGGFSAVYIAQNQKGEKFVLKEAVLPGNADENSKLKAHELFQREARILMKLDHPHIAKILDHFVEHGRDYLVLEYIPGKTLRQLVKVGGPQEEKNVINWSGQVATTIEYLHSQTPPVVHRDLTPDNLVLRDDGTVVVVDFGAANEVLSGATGTMIGKQSYIPPEQFRGKAQPQSDIYALGATMYFLLTGCDPIPLSRSSPKEAKAHISAQLDELVASATALDPQERVKSATEFCERIQILKDDEAKS